MKKLILCLMLLVMTSCGQQQSETNNNALLETEKTVTISNKFLIVIGNEFGNTYFDMKEALTEQGFEVVTVFLGENPVMSSCPNHEEILVTGDRSISDLNDSNIEDYFGVFIPAGKHHRSMIYSTKVHQLLTLANEHQLIISSVCAGNLVLASTEDLIDDVEIATSMTTRDAIKESGGVCKYQEVVTFNNFVTGSEGGGKTGDGHAGAPIQEMVDAIKEIYDQTLSLQ
ncbi:MAG: DJ-1/PfpI family protein [Clostridia bacterium]|nr:DJ-1/PfpI family protein [Clostridia bacterium]